MNTVLLLLLALGSPATDYAAGLAALKAKQASVALPALQRCVQAAPEHVECWWELGWAHWLQRDWEATGQAWERVEALDPTHPELQRYLAQAKAQATLTKQLAEENAAAEEGSAPSEAASANPASHDGPPKPDNDKASRGAAASELAGQTLRLRAVGDVMLGTTFPKGYLPPEDGARMLSKVQTLMADADISFVNLEGPLCDEGETRKCRAGGNCYAFRCPTRYGRYLKLAGVDVASTANNHSGDFGELCRRSTERTLDALGIAWSGPPGTVAELQRKGKKIALIAFHASSATNDLNDLPRAKLLVKRAARDHDLVIVSFHGGAEGRKAQHVKVGPEFFYGENRGDLRRFAHAVIEAGADLVLGHGPHVARGMELYRGRLIAYSLGNFATYGRFNLGGPLALGMILEVELSMDGRFVRGRILPTRQLGKGVPEPDPNAEVTALVRRLSRADFGARAMRVSAKGELLPPKQASRTSVPTAPNPSVAEGRGP